MSLLPLLLAITAFLLLGLATDAHYRLRFGSAPGPARRILLRRVGWIALVGAFVPAILAQGWIFGPILWSGAIMGGAAAAFLALNMLPGPRH